MTAQAWLLLACLPWMIAASATDVRRRLVPDWAALGLALAGLAAAALSGGWPGALVAGIGVAALGAAAATGGLWGWGDVKLFAAAAAAAGLDRLPQLLLATSLTGAVIAATLMLLRPWARARGPAPPHWPRWVRAELTRLRRAPSTPYAVAISGGLLAVLTGI